MVIYLVTITANTYKKIRDLDVYHLDLKNELQKKKAITGM